MEQPPLSQRIRRLEKDLGAELFDRGGGQVTLTAAGHVLMREAPELLKRHQRLRSLVLRAAESDPANPPRPWSSLY
ncbi:regulatory helix-turn-helix protein, lysR family [Glycomyces harbinensis]|uniref:Regulatory helix-turn-helix protein, lysR family n=2 Tax=Glycomyces harbinensis TaxID=58114 RepID=A0A1G6RRC2_9ACTN|nr:regulatory helix-turn-helix protein, lysR family [Glycomyces harbinensis]